jgi:hypothetical protein
MASSGMVWMMMVYGVMAIIGIGIPVVILVFNILILRKMGEIKKRIEILEVEIDSRSLDRQETEF